MLPPRINVSTVTFPEKPPVEIVPILPLFVTSCFTFRFPPVVIVPTDGVTAPQISIELPSVKFEPALFKVKSPKALVVEEV